MVNPLWKKGVRKTYKIPQVELMISTRVDRTYYAMQLGSLIILPLLVFAIGGVSGILIMGPLLLLGL